MRKRGKKLLSRFLTVKVNPLAQWALPLYSLTGTQGERVMHLSDLVSKGINPSPLPSPIALRGIAEQYKGDTEGTIIAKKRGKKLLSRFLTVKVNPLAQWALPLYSLTGTQGERVMHLSDLVSKGINPSPLPSPIALRGIAEQYKGDTEGTIIAKKRGKKLLSRFLMTFNPSVTT
ncbi:hypothetical protein [Barnesiella intestinihominis]|uniref:hypothetical protein n=3 Tax=Barnesiella intestinihominis TaxID=487174 RepID=UPI00189A7F8E|nr:hypothetical protein [Barnesiella intestinihominis]